MTLVKGPNILALWKIVCANWMTLHSPYSLILATLKLSFFWMLSVTVVKSVCVSFPEKMLLMRWTFCLIVFSLPSSFTFIF